MVVCLSTKSIQYQVDARLHREDGPALLLSDGTHKWYQFDMLHRADGPAVELADGTRIWFLQGKRVAKKALPFEQAQDQVRRMEKALCKGAKNKAPTRSAGSAMGRAL